jgi:hypothetical protein
VKIERQVKRLPIKSLKGEYVKPLTFSTYVCVVAFVGATSGCASYHVSSNVESTPSAPQTTTTAVFIAEDSLPGRKYTEMGLIEVSIKKLTLFHKDPTKELANEALIEKAKSLGASAVIKVKYKTGVGFTTWGYIDASGTAVKFIE